MRLLPFVVVAVLAGCIGPGTTPTDPRTPVDPALAFVAEHDHFDLAEHDVAWNVTMTAWDPVVPRGQPSGGHAVDLHGNLLAMAMYAVSGEGERGLALFDVSVPATPRLVGKYLDERAKGGDRMAMFSADGKTVFLGAETSAWASQNPATPPEQRQEVFDTLLLAIDVSDPSAPKLAGETTVPGYGPHTVFATEVGGAQYVYVVSYGLQIFRYEGGAFEFVGRYAAASPGQLLANEDGPEQTRTYATRSIYGHDVFAWEDPVTGGHVAFYAGAYEGLKVLDLSDPRFPREVGTWIPDGPDAPSYVHTVTVKMFGERRIAAVGAETFEGRNRDVPSPVWFLDVTDLASPQLLATYTNPAGVGSQDLLFSAHDMRFDESDGGVRLWLANYHGGIWVLDVDDPAAPRVAGFYLPNEDNGYVPPEDCCSGLRMSGTPLTFDVVARNGIGYAADMWTGLYTLRLGS